MFFQGILLLAMLGLQWPSFNQLLAQYQVDDRRDLESWMLENIPAGSIVAQDRVVGLPDPEDHRQKYAPRSSPFLIRGDEFVADLGALAELKQQGIKYFAISDSKYGRYLIKTVSAKGMEETFERRKKFYETLRKEGELIWNRPPKQLGVLHPGVRLFRLSDE